MWGEDFRPLVPRCVSTNKPHQIHQGRDEGQEHLNTLSEPAPTSDFIGAGTSKLALMTSLLSFNITVRSPLDLNDLWSLLSGPETTTKKGSINYIKVFGRRNFLSSNKEKEDRTAHGLQKISKNNARDGKYDPHT